MKIITGDRIGRGAPLVAGCAAIIWDGARQKILLTRRSDNGRWCLPGGRMESGESAAEACAREVLEETGLHVRVTRLVGVYTSPNFVVEYADGNRFQIVAMSFEAEVVGGALELTNETTEFGYFTPRQIASMDLVEHHVQRIADAVANRPEALVR
jgi:ADP-ribose pyrophosphatase YjhB (NUDIX family)